MTGHRHILTIGVGVFLFSLALSCGGKSPSAPTPSGPGTIATSLALTGSVPLTTLKQTMQMTATATLSDGSQQDVTAQSQWSSGDDSIAKVSAGLVTAEGYGTVTVYADYRGLSAFADLRVLPAGTFILSGTVTEPVDQSIDQAHLQFTGGSGVAPGTAITDFNGSYRVVGLSGSVTVKVSHSGYHTLSKTVTMSQDRTLDFELEPTTAPSNVAGTYHLTFTASIACGAQVPPLPQELAKRTYTAHVEQSGAGLTVQLSGADFIPAHQYGDRLSDLFTGRISGKTVSFLLGSSDYYGRYYDVAEHVGMRYLAISGDADGTVSGSKMSGTLAGPFDVFDNAPPRAHPSISCTAADHHFSFTK